MKPNLSALLLGPAVILAMLTGCTGDSPAGPRKHTSSSSSPRVVSLLPNATSIMFDLGAGDLLVGVTRYCDHPPEAQRIPGVGGILDVSLEAVAALKPDLVIGSPSVLSGRFTDVLGSAGVTFLRLGFEDLDDLRAGIRKIGAAIGRDAAAARLVSDVDSSLASLAGTAPPARVLFVVGTKPLVVASSSSFQGQLIQKMGLTNVAVSEKVKFPTWSFEQVIQSSPDLIIDGIVGGEPSAALLADAGIRAPIVRIPDDAILLPGPRAVEVAGKLAELVKQTLVRPEVVD